MDEDAGTYPPLNSLKPIVENVWIVDGPTIRFGMPGLRFPFPTRMTVVRLAGADLFIHSPTPLAPALRREICEIGTPRWLIGPNRLHYWWIPEWRAAFAAADVYLAPGIKEQAAGRIDFSAFPLIGENGFPWDHEIATLPIAGSFMTEIEFFHRPSRTMILTDLIENFEPRKLQSFAMRWLTRLGGAQDPDGQTPRDMRLSFARQKQQVRAAVVKMIAWQPERVILAHGRWYERNGTAELRRALRWVLS
jgi:Domain of unknown function (DUF4336)